MYLVTDTYECKIEYQAQRIFVNTATTTIDCQAIYFVLLLHVIDELARPSLDHRGGNVPLAYRKRVHDSFTWDLHGDLAELIHRNPSQLQNTAHANT